MNIPLAPTAWAQCGVDEQIVESQRQLLKSWGIPAKHIGHDIGRKGMKDYEIIPFLHRLRRVTFFTLRNVIYLR